MNHLWTALEENWKKQLFVFLSTDKSLPIKPRKRTRVQKKAGEILTDEEVLKRLKLEELEWETKKKLKEIQQTLAGDFKSKIK